MFSAPILNSQARKHKIHRIANLSIERLEYIYIYILQLDKTFSLIMIFPNCCTAESLEPGHLCQIYPDSHTYLVQNSCDFYPSPYLKSKFPKNFIRGRHTPFSTRRLSWVLQNPAWCNSSTVGIFTPLVERAARSIISLNLGCSKALGG